MGVGYSNCRNCHQRILWARTDEQKSMPLDPVPNPGGNVACRRDPNTDIVFGRVITDATPRLAGEIVHMPHFASCSARPVPKPKVVTSRNAKVISRRKRITEPVQMDLVLPLPANVVPFRRSDPS